MGEEKEKAKRKADKQVRSCEFESRLDKIAEAYGCGQEEAFDKVINRVKGLKCIEHYAGVIHDKDEDEITGELKAPHTHIVLELRYPMTFRQVAGQIGMPEQTVCKIHQKKMQGNGKWVVDIGGALSYLTHRNAPEKFQYPDDIVVATEGWDWRAVRAKSEKFQNTSDLEGIFSGIVEGVITEGNMTDYIDYHVYIENRKAIENAFEFRRKKLMQDHNRNILCMYLCGEKGTGKTTLAKQFCEERKLRYFITGGSNDPLDSYSDEDAIIIDDARPSMFRPDEWLKLLDNNTGSLVKSRYHNKMIQARYIILTSAVPIMQFFADYGEEDPAQLYRRIKVMMEVHKDIICLYEYDSNTGNYRQFGYGRNPVSKKYENTDISEEERDDLISSFGIHKEAPMCMERKVKAEHGRLL